MLAWLKKLSAKKDSGPIRIFISYSTDDAITAGSFKYCFEHHWNFSAFLAHEDLEPSSEWEQEILRNLENCEIFLPLITSHFHPSKWTDQESGIAFAKGKIILPVCFDRLTPYGFIKRYQAFFHNAGAVPSDSVKGIVEILEGKGFKKRIFEGAITGLENSGSYDTTRILVRFLSERISLIKRTDFDRLKIAQANNGNIGDEIYKFPDFIKKLEAKFSK